MTGVSHKDFLRNTDCHWAARSQNVNSAEDLLQSLSSASSTVLACNDKEPQSKMWSPVSVSTKSIYPTSSRPSVKRQSNGDERASIQPLAILKSPQLQAWSTSTPAQSALYPPVQITEENVTILSLSISTTPSSSMIFLTATTSAPPAALVPEPTSPGSSSLALSASIPYTPVLTSEPSPKQTAEQSPPAVPEPFPITIGTSDSGLDSASPSTPSVKHEVSPRAGYIIGGVISGVILFALLLTIYFCRRMRRKQLQRSLRYISTTSMYKPRRQREVEGRNKSAYLEGLSDLERNLYEGRGVRTNQVKPMKDLVTQFPLSPAGFAYDGKGATSRSLRPLTMPELVFAPLRANRSSSLYSGSLLNELGFIRQASPRKARARSALIPLTGPGKEDDRAAISNPIMTPADIFKQKSRSPATRIRSPPRSDIYISRPYSVFDIADEDTKDRRRDSAISGVLQFEDSRLFSSLPLSHSSQSRSQPRFQSRSRSGSRYKSPSRSYSRASTPDLSSSRSKSPSHLQYSRASAPSYANPTSATVERALVTVRDLDKDVRLSLDVDEEYGYRLHDLNGARDPEFTSNYRNGNLWKQKKVKVIESKAKNEVVVDRNERDVGYDVESDGHSENGLEEWEQRAMEKRIREKERAKVRAYKGRIRPGMGVQKRGGREIGVERKWTGSAA